MQLISKANGQQTISNLKDVLQRTGDDEAEGCLPVFVWHEDREAGVAFQSSLLQKAFL